MSQPVVAIIIATYGREHVLVETIQSILKVERDLTKTKILVVDQTLEHEADTTAYLLAQEKAGSIIWFRPPEINFAALTKARNFGVAEAKDAEVIVFVDDDVEVQPDFLKQHLTAYEDSAVMATAGRVVTINQPDSVNNRTVGQISWFGNFAANYSGDYDQNVTDFMGCNFSLRTSVLAKTGLFEEGQASRSAIREDSDMAVRVREVGGIIRFVAKAEVLHKFFPSGGTRSEKDRIVWYFGLFHDNFMFYAKHAPTWRMPFFALHMWRPLLACSFWYGKGRPTAIVQPWKGMAAGIKAGKASRHTGMYAPLKPTHWPVI